jgi:multidrug resistance efflux pump
MRNIEAHGALQLAQAQFERIGALGERNAVSQEEVFAAKINFQTAKRKVDLLAAIVRGAINASKADLEAAEAYGFLDKAGVTKP